jgi:hypothetical protein
MSHASRSRADRAPSRLVAIGIVLAMTVAPAILAGRAEAAPASMSAVTAATDLCSAARNVAGGLTHATSLTQGNITPATLKTAYTKLQAAEPSLLASSSGALKADLTQVFAFLNLLVADLKKANWKVAGLAGQLPGLEVQAVKAKKPLQALDNYFTNTCHIKS